MNAINLNRTSEVRKRPRSYNSLLRRQQTKDTKKKILKALLAEVSRNGLRDFSYPRLAKRARVSLGTIWRHFPSHQSMSDALQDEFKQLTGDLHYPENPEEIITLVNEAYPKLDKNVPLMTAISYWRANYGIGLQSRLQRLEKLEKALEPLTAGLDLQERRRTHAMLSLLCSSVPWQTMKQEFGLDGIESSKAVEWAVRALLADLRSRNAESTGSGNQSTDRRG